MTFNVPLGENDIYHPVTPSQRVRVTLDDGKPEEFYWGFLPDIGSMLYGEEADSKVLKIERDRDGLQHFYLITVPRA